MRPIRASISASGVVRAAPDAWHRARRAALPAGTITEWAPDQMQARDAGDEIRHIPVGGFITISSAVPV